MDKTKNRQTFVLSCRTDVAAEHASHIQHARTRSYIISYRKSLEPAHIHHVVGVLGYDGGAPHCDSEGCDHVRWSVGVFRVRQNLLHQQVVLLDPLNWFDQKVPELETLQTVN